jgi:hypothetical protein
MEESYCAPNAAAMTQRLQVRGEGCTRNRKDLCLDTGEVIEASSGGSGSSGDAD